MEGPAGLRNAMDNISGAGDVAGAMAIWNLPGDATRATGSAGPMSPSLAPMGGGASTRSQMSGLPTSQRTSSPSGRMHPNPARRAELRKADMHYNIDYYGGFGAPD